MAIYLDIPGIVATPTLDRVRREERLHGDMPRRQRFTSQKPIRKKTSDTSVSVTTSIDDLEIDVSDRNETTRQRFDFTA